MGAVMLGDYLASAQGKTFRYGSHDCAMFAARWVLAQTGRDLMLGIRYRSLREGLELLRAAGFESHIEAAASQLEEVPPLMARRGDIAAVERCLGIITGERVALLERDGMATVPLTSATRAFRI